MIRDEVMVDKYGAHVDPVYLKILIAVKGKDKIINRYLFYRGK